MSRAPKKFPRAILQRRRRIAGRFLLFIVGIALACTALETYLRLKWPFLHGEIVSHFHPKVGITRQPNAEMRWTKEHSEFWTVQPVNSLGFLDREPPSLEQTSTGCHIAIIGDSFVEARQVSIADKFHIRLEQLAGKELPRLNITTSAFGIGNTGQINQLPYWDEFARHLRPCVFVLVFVQNDFANNHPVLQALDSGGWDPDHNPFTTATKSEDGTLRLRPPDRKFIESRLPRLPMSWASRLRIYSSERLYLAKWLHSKLLLWEYNHSRAGEDPELDMWVNLLSRRPGYDSLADEWPSLTEKGRYDHPHSIYSVFGKKDLPPVFEEALEFTAFALDQFKARAERDDIPLLILSTHTMGTRGDWNFDRMHALAEERGIPVIDQADYILRQGGRIEDACWTHDGHWTPIGHQWAAEALLEYLKENPHICRTQSSGSNSPGAIQ